MLILDENDKPRTEADINRIVCAEIPDPETEPQLYRTVTRCMNHGYCGIKNPRAQCMENGICTKRYPKQFNPTTSMNNDGYPTYRRRNDQRTFISRSGELIDNQYIIPYNKVLSTMFDCHINVEICSSVKAIQYIYKYICKGTVHEKN